MVTRLTGGSARRRRSRPRTRPPGSQEGYARPAARPSRWRDHLGCAIPWPCRGRARAGRAPSGRRPASNRAPRERPDQSPNGASLSLRSLPSNSAKLRSHRRPIAPSTDLRLPAFGPTSRSSPPSPNCPSNARRGGIAPTHEGVQACYSYQSWSRRCLVERNANPYLALGVRPFINCCSVRTMHGGSLMLPQVRAAMDAASRQFVNLDELMEAAGKRLAELTGAEWGIVTCGSAAAVALGTAACVAGNDPVKMLRLPFTDGWVNRVILPKNQRFAYAQAIRMVGAHIVEIDNVADLDAALREPVAMVAILGTNEEFSNVHLEEIVARVKPLGIPVLVDAASEHLQRPSPWLQRGADMVIYSGGKFLRGPQTSGLLLGNKNLVQAAWRNASPHQAFGRPMKVSKEDVIGLLTALEYWMEERDVGTERTRWRDDCAEMAKPL